MSKVFKASLREHLTQLERFGLHKLLSFVDFTKSLLKANVIS